MGDTNNVLASIKERDLPPPNISSEKINGLLRALTADHSVVETTSTSKSSPIQLLEQQTLKGREVFIPVFGGVAFYEGELRPHTRSKPGSSDNNNEEEEIVYIATQDTTTATSNRSAKRQHQQQHQQIKSLNGNKNEIQILTVKENATAVSLLEAIEWLQKHSTVAEALSKSKNAKARATNVASAAAAATTKPSKHPSSMKQASAPDPTPKQQPSKSRSREPDDDDYYQAPAVAGPMFNINEEYSADGTRIVGEAVNLSTRIKAVYGNENPYGEDGKTETEDAPFDPTLGKKAKAAAATKNVSDEAYDRMSKRLEELALMEEEEIQRKKEGRRKPAKPLGGGGDGSGASTRVRNPKSSSSSFGFKKGFLNKTSSASKKKATKKRDATATTKPSTNASEGAATKASSTTANRENPSKPPSRGINIDVSQNKVHEIPREGRQQPVPVRKQSQVDINDSHTTSNRLLDASVFSGQISERTNPPMAGSSSLLNNNDNSGVISRDVASRVAANEQTQSLQHELEQRQQRQTRPKRVSRFRQQRQEEHQERY